MQWRLLRRQFNTTTPPHQWDTCEALEEGVFPSFEEALDRCLLLNNHEEEYRQYLLDCLGPSLKDVVSYTSALAEVDLSMLRSEELRTLAFERLFGKHEVIRRPHTWEPYTYHRWIMKKSVPIYEPTDIEVLPHPHYHKYSMKKLLGI